MPRTKFRRLSIAATALVFAAVAAVVWSTAGGEAPATPVLELESRSTGVGMRTRSRAPRRAREPQTEEGRASSDPATVAAATGHLPPAPDAPEPDPPEAAHRDAVLTRALYAELDRLLEEAAIGHLRSTRTPTTSRTSEPTDPHTIASARRWASRELGPLLWSNLERDLQWTAEEVANAWKARRPVGTRRASYGGGSFVVVPGSDRGARPDSGAEEAWWTDAPRDERVSWLKGYFVESSGLFEVVRIVELDCGLCDRNAVSDLEARRALCDECGGAGVVRDVVFR